MSTKLTNVLFSFIACASLTLGACRGASIGVDLPKGGKHISYRDGAGHVARLVGRRDLDPDMKAEHRYTDEDVERFSSVFDCLTRKEARKERPDLTKIDWGRISNDGEASLCIAYIAGSYATREDMIRWFYLQGFDANLHGKNKSVHAGRDTGHKGPKFVSGPFDRLFKNVLVRATTVIVVYDRSGRARYADVGYTIE